jgi:chitinase
MFLDQLDMEIFDHDFDHPDPQKVDSNGNREQVSFCTYFEALWRTDKITIGTRTLTPAAHISDCYPTRRRFKEELVVLEHVINAPAKAKVR